MGGSHKYQPTLKELLAYKRGELPPEKAGKIEKALEGNSMLSAALAGIELTDIGAAENISENVTKKIDANLQEAKHIGVSKFSIAIVSSLIFMSVVAAIYIGLQVVGSYSIMSSDYTQVPDFVKIDSFEEIKEESGRQTLKSTSKDSVRGQDQSIINADDNTDVYRSENNLSNTLEDDRSDYTGNPSDQTSVNTNTVDSSNSMESINEAENYGIGDVNKIEQDGYGSMKQTTKDSLKNVGIPHEGDEKMKSNVSKDGTSFVKSIELMTKTTMADKGDTKNTGSGSPFLQSSSYKSKDNNKKNVKKLPEFEGGDEALKNYIKDEIGKVEVKNIASYRTDFYLRFVIDNDGTMITWKILGNIAPEVKEVVRLLMEEMPQWSPSTEKGKKGEVEYTYSIKLNENL